uniref:uncharacterized protein LOC105353523 n=1 Tax=Fragaria vesca subsp. vesca TaxID=101020 RepID=UPI0005C89E7F|nr:PREDICTED: uncharacterized protein LOC105353523 [Fragaria vesca subsp. vesca]
MVKQVNGMLKVKVPESDSTESGVVTDLEKTMFREEDMTQEDLPRVSVFRRLTIDPQPRVSMFQRLGEIHPKPQKNRKWKLKVKQQRVLVAKQEDESTHESSSTNCVSIEENQVEDEEEYEFIDSAQLAPPQIEDGGQATVDELQKINLGTSEHPKPIFVSALLTTEEFQDYKNLLEEYKDVFAWGYQDMPGLDPEVAVHNLAVSEEKVKYPTWLASIVPVEKKNGQIRICVDYRDLNEACPKDEFPLPITELLVDATTGFGALSFMDGFSGYNQIKMAPEDEEFTAFRTPKGYRGIEIGPTKIKAIREMPAPKNLRELRGLQGRLAYIRRFISNLSGRCQPFSRLMKKDVPFIWDQACQIAFDSIKEYLLHPPVLMAPIKGKSLILYIAALEHSLGALLAQNNDEGKENALCYLSRTLVGAEHNYTPIEKICLALVYAVQKLRHYLLAHSVTLISRADPLKYLMTKPMPSGRLAKWSLILSEFEIKYVPQKAIKG